MSNALLEIARGQLHISVTRTWQSFSLGPFVTLHVSILLAPKPFMALERNYVTPRLRLSCRCHPIANVVLAKACHCHFLKCLAFTSDQMMTRL